ncbi:MAG TPA: ABC transporter substrate-binding protein [Lachnospiraceae bacterium]|nr:ABC transporter substrate-binding protein [Lachnospiraceae bacterium]
MKKNLKKVVATALSAIMIFSMVGCGSDKGTVDSGKNATGSETSTNENKDIVTLKWVQVGSGMPSNYDAWKENINAYLADKIGVNLEMEVVSWGDWDNRRSVMVNTNGEYDILFTNSGTYASDVRLGAFYDISDLVQTETKDLYASIPADYWEASKIDGKVYAVPTYKDSSMTQYFVWDKELADKYNIDYNSLTTLDSLTSALTTMKEGENTAPFVLNSLGLDSILATYDQMSAGLAALGVKYDDETRTVVSVLEQEDILDQLKTLNGWYKTGIINSDAATLAENPAYRSCFVAQGWSMAASTTWGPQMGVEATAVQWGKTIVSNDTVRGSLSCISSSSKNPQKALELLELVNTDSFVRDALYYGLEGENFEYTADGKVNKLNADWTMAGYTQGTFFNVSQLADDEVNQWNEVKELNANAEPSVLLGFTFDYSSVEDQLSNCVEIYNRYRSEILTGTKEPVAEVAAMMKEMRAAGFDDIMAVAQEQVNATYK